MKQEYRSHMRDWCQTCGYLELPAHCAGCHPQHVRIDEKSPDGHLKGTPMHYEPAPQGIIDPHAARIIC